MGEPLRHLHAKRLTEVPFKLLVDSVQDYAIFMLDTNGNIASWNKGAQRAKGYTEQEIIGRHFSIFYTQADRDRNHPEYELKVARETGVYEEEGWRVKKDGTLFWANVVITAVHDETGELIGFGKVTRDLTERRRHEQRERDLQKERDARIEAEAASRAKSEFLTTMSHELRTPLNAIIGYVDLLELGIQGQVTPEQKDSLERVRRSSKHLLSLINDVLNIARIEAGGIPYSLKTTSANQILSDVEPLVATQFASHNIAFRINYAEPDAEIICDPERAQQILLNLLTNAYKFTRANGEVKIETVVHERTVDFIVRDTGRGIPHDKLQNIFDPFVQIDRHLNRESQQGVGLGLAISRNLARGMSGELTVSSEVAVGSAFTLTLPRSTG